jgi:S1-C subfamily serine protease
MNLQRSFPVFFAKQSNTFRVALALIVCMFAVSSVPAFAQDAADVAKPAMAAAVWVEKLDASGNTVKRSSGFVVKDGRVVTSFRSIDGAMSLKLIFADGKEVRTDKVAGVNRYQDWVLIPLEDKSRPGLTLVSKNSSAGDHCYWLEVKPDGTRAVAEGQLTGVTTSRPSSSQENSAMGRWAVRCLMLKAK